jgi:hypothetical protein
MLMVLMAMGAMVRCLSLLMTIGTIEFCDGQKVLAASGHDITLAFMINSVATRAIA